MVVFPNAKINLGLDILKKREDGFHDIESIFLPIGLSDILEVTISDTLKFSSTGIKIPDSKDGNLVLLAWKYLNQDYKIKPIQAHLHKVVPIGAGLGGGSSDAAFMLKALSNLFELNLTDLILESYAAKIGSDCAFFINNKTALAEGRGEKLLAIDFDISEYKILLINPGIHIGTSEAYSNIIPNVPKSRLIQSIKQPIENWQRLINNDFEDSIFPSYPEISKIKEDMYQMGAIYAAMSGSGSSVFGLFKKSAELKHTDLFPSYFSWTGPILM